MVVELKPRIVVFGVGGAGGNAVNNMIESNLQGVDFIVANTDSQALLQSQAPQKIQLGVTVTEGLGAGAQPTVGAAAAEESIDDIRSVLDGAHMVFVAAGMGGGTGTGAAPVIAKVARDQGILTVGVVTKPFDFEGRRRMTIAEGGVGELRDVVDTLIIIPNQNLFRIANAQTTLSDAFSLADDVLHAGVRGITDLMVMPGLINLDFADVKTVMQEMGAAMMGTGEGAGEDRARTAAEAAINNPLLDDVSMRGAKGVLINITGGDDMTLYEVDEAANLVRAEVDPDAQIILGSAFNPNMDGKLRVSVVATGIEASAYLADRSSAAPAASQPVVATRPAATAPAPAEPAVQPAPVSEAPQEEAEPAPVVDIPIVAQDDDPAPEAIQIDQASTAAPIDDDERREGLLPQSPVINPRPAVMDQPDQLGAPFVNEAARPEESPPAHTDNAIPKPPPFMPEPDPSDAAQQQGSAAPQDEEKPSGFSGLFGWRRNTGGSENVDTQGAPDDYTEDDLEIPAFLRRSANK